MNKVCKDSRQRNFRILALFILCLALAGLALFLYLGQADVPSSSPLADPSYAIQPLNDATVKDSHKLPPSADYPVNQLNNGESWLPSLLVLAFVELAWIIILLSLRLKSFTIVVLTAGQYAIGMDAAKVLAYIPFMYGSLRAGAQPLIDGSHRWRVTLAYIQLWCDQYDKYAYQIIGVILVTVVCVSFILAVAIDYFGWTRQLATHESEQTA